MDGDSSVAKRTVLEKLLEDGMVLVTVDARHPQVDVPGHLHDDPQLRLNLSYRFGLPMTVDELGVHATLTFRGTPYPCHLPWDYIYMVVSHATGQPFIFPADVPEDLPVEVGQESVEPQPVRKPQLRVVAGEGGAADSAEAAAEMVPLDGDVRPESSDANPEDTDSPPKIRSRDHLRVIK